MFIDDRDAHFFGIATPPHDGEEMRFEGIVVGLAGHVVHARGSDGAVYSFNVPPESVGIDGYFSPQTARTLTKIEKITYANAIANPFANFCLYLEYLGVFSFNNLRSAPPRSPSDKFMPPLEALLVLKRKSAEFFKNHDFTPTPVFSFVSSNGNCGSN